MNKKLVVLILIVAGGLALILPWVFSHQTKELGSLAYETKEIAYNRAGDDNRDTYSIKAEYPFFTDGFTEEVAGKINDTLTAAVRSTALSVKKEFEDQFGSGDDTNTYVPPVPLSYEGQADVSADLEKLPFVNITLNGYQYSGGAHGLTVITTSVFDVETGNRITLPVLFEGDYLNSLSRLALAEIKRIDPELTTFTFAEDGTLPSENNFSTFTLKPDGFHLIFQSYQVAPYVVGEPEIVIPYASLEDILDPKYKEVLL